MRQISSREPGTAGDPALMRLALDLAVEAAGAGLGGPFAALVVQEGRVIASGVNRVVEDADPTAHAEVVAIRAACRRLGSFHLRGCELYATCEPCPLCLAAAYWARVERIFYAATSIDAAGAGFDDVTFHKELASPAGERTIAAVPLLTEEARRPFEAWAANPRRVLY
jgi:tRNA(Arg) A34 adenosine deaminase TadA